jgi:hypothetical protein
MDCRERVETGGIRHGWRGSEDTSPKLGKGLEEALGSGSPALRFLVFDELGDAHQVIGQHRCAHQHLEPFAAGRNGITPSQTLRSLILMRVKNWDYRDLRDRINDGYTLRGFTQFDCQPVPSMTPSTGPSTGSLQPRSKPSTNW